MDDGEKQNSTLLSKYFNVISMTENIQYKGVHKNNYVCDIIDYRIVHFTINGAYYCNNGNLFSVIFNFDTIFKRKDVLKLKS